MKGEYDDEDDLKDVSMDNEGNMYRVDDFLQFMSLNYVGLYFNYDFLH